MSLDQYNELMAKRKELDEQIDAVAAEAKADAVAQVKAEMQRLGVTMTDLVGRKPVPAKYRDTESGRTWSGRGKTPKWFTEGQLLGTIVEI